MQQKYSTLAPQNRLDSDSTELEMRSVSPVGVGMNVGLILVLAIFGAFLLRPLSDDGAIDYVVGSLADGSSEAEAGRSVLFELVCSKQHDPNSEVKSTSLCRDR